MFVEVGVRATGAERHDRPIAVTACGARRNNSGNRPAWADDLADKLKAAAALETAGLGELVASARQGMLLCAPNPDGKTWDLLQICFPRYGGPNTIVVIDLGSGEARTIPTEAGWNFRLCPTVIAADGRLFISVLNSRLQQKICIYDPATNELKVGAVEMPEELLGETHLLVMGVGDQAGIEPRQDHCVSPRSSSAEAGFGRRICGGWRRGNPTALRLCKLGPSPPTP
jgi:hypothetical protein